MVQGAARGQDPSSFGGLEIGNDWVTQFQDEEGKQPFPPLVDSRFPSGSWTSHLEHHIAAGTLHLLQPNNPNLNITEALLDPLERIPGRQVNEGVISTFFGQTKAMRMVLENGDESALILEDDVDVEWDLERMWSRIERRLPADWEVSFLGHCWGKELLRTSSPFLPPRKLILDSKQDPPTSTPNSINPPHPSVSTPTPSPNPAPRTSSPSS